MKRGWCKIPPLAHCWLLWVPSSRPASEVCFDGGNPTASVGKALLVMLWSPEIQRLAALAPQVSHLQVYRGTVAPVWSKSRKTNTRLLYHIEPIGYSQVFTFALPRFALPCPDLSHHWSWHHHRSNLWPEPQPTCHWILRRPLVQIKRNILLILRTSETSRVGVRVDSWSYRPISIIIQFKFWMNNPRSRTLS